MAKGESGRIVLEVDSTLKKQLYSMLALDETTLKDWFIEQAKNYIAQKKKDISDEV